MKRFCSIIKTSTMIALLGSSCFYIALAAETKWDQVGLAALQDHVSDTKSALDIIASCLAYIDSNYTITHLDNATNTYCTDDPEADILLRLTNFEILLATIETGANTFCCSTKECAANCPTNTNLGAYTCASDCKTPHPPGLLTTLEPTTRIQNLAKRLLAVEPLINVENPIESTTSCTPSSTQTGSSSSGSESLTVLTPPVTKSPTDTTGL